VLFGCHGTFDAQEPLRSGVQLADGRLTLGRLLNDIPLPKTEMVVLCACQTAMIDFGRLPDEVVGLPAGFLQAGVQCVVAALWPVMALPAVLLLRRFYVLVVQGVTPANALRQSALWLRGLHRTDLLDEISSLREHADPSTAFMLDRAAFVDFLNSQPFASPIYWAAFTYNGAFL